MAHYQLRRIECPGWPAEVELVEVVDDGEPVGKFIVAETKAEAIFILEQMLADAKAWPVLGEYDHG